MKNRISKTNSLLIIIIIYIIAVSVGYLVHRAFSSHGLLVSVFLGDIAATVVVWLAGVIFNNSSVYDPYWSVAPIIIVGFWIIEKDSSIVYTDILALVAVAFWGIRLTVNWAINWRGMNSEDWRYSMLREKNKEIWQLVNLGGINLMPTVLVYLGLFPAYYMIFHCPHKSIAMYLGFAICIISPVIQLIADKQMKDHRDKNTNKYIDSGLWKYSRHPNYFGEICFWWGLFIMQIGVSKIYISAVGAVLITLLFVFISIPMMEKHMTEKPYNYEEYKNRVSMVMLWRSK